MSKNEVIAKTWISGQKSKTWISGQKSCTLIIEKELAKEYGLIEPSHVVLEKRPEGILIRKLHLDVKEQCYKAGV